ncbi:hypothetical protein ACRALDRAFT_1061556, partial [Sodiomyces alcalophilus JCM 7366]|uniref:uncharacterized protein n=1 Tax=Sodiomyces alcalophilus JCM 7366 TaxID=591952 RepID=UPI0039B39463
MAPRQPSTTRDDAAMPPGKISQRIPTSRRALPALHPPPSVRAIWPFPFLSSDIVGRVTLPPSTYTTACDASRMAGPASNAWSASG